MNGRPWARKLEYSFLNYLLKHLDAFNIRHTVSKMTNDISKKKGKSSSEKKAKRKAKRRETYAMYIYKVLKQVGEKKARAQASTAS